MIASKTQLLLLSMVVSSVAFADDICPDTKDKKRAEAMFAQAQQREQACDARAAPRRVLTHEREELLLRDLPRVELEGSDRDRRRAPEPRV